MNNLATFYQGELVYLRKDNELQADGLMASNREGGY